MMMAGTVASATKQLPIEIVVHRGANALAPENTWPSAEAALQYGATWIEVDVRTSKDGVLFNLHDETLDRTTNGKGQLSDMLSVDVRKLDAGSWFAPQFAGLRDADFRPAFVFDDAHSVILQQVSPSDPEQTFFTPQITTGPTLNDRARTPKRNYGK